MDDEDKETKPKKKTTTTAAVAPFQHKLFGSPQRRVEPVFDFEEYEPNKKGKKKK